MKIITMRQIILGHLKWFQILKILVQVASLAQLLETETPKFIFLKPRKFKIKRLIEALPEKSILRTEMRATEGQGDSG